jgi:hypothetical protein
MRQAVELEVADAIDRFLAAAATTTLANVQGSRPEIEESAAISAAPNDQSALAAIDPCG